MPNKFKYHAEWSYPDKNQVFVFGSNERGRHGAGAAKAAADRYGAIERKSVGLGGRSYAIPTKDKRILSLPLPAIKKYIDDFVKFTHEHKDMEFFVTRIANVIF